MSQKTWCRQRPLPHEHKKKILYFRMCLHISILRMHIFHSRKDINIRDRYHTLKCDLRFLLLRNLICCCRYYTYVLLKQRNSLNYIFISTYFLLLYSVENRYSTYYVFPISFCLVRQCVQRFYQIQFNPESLNRGFSVSNRIIMEAQCGAVRAQGNYYNRYTQRACERYLDSNTCTVRFLNDDRSQECNILVKLDL